MNIVAKVMKKRWGRQVRLNIDHGGTQGLVYIAKDGWDKDKYENREGVSHSWGLTGQTRGKQIRLSLNSPLRMTYTEWRQLVDAIEEEYDYIRRGPDPV